MEMISTFRCISTAGILATAALSTTHASESYGKSNYYNKGMSSSSGSTSISSEFLRNYYGSGTVNLKISSATVVTTDVEKYPEHIESVKNIFKLSDEELAKAFKVTRKTLYNWKTKGSESHSAKTRKRIFDLYVLSKDWTNLNIPNQKLELEKPVLENKSIKDLIFEDSIDCKMILFAANRLKSVKPEDDLF